MAWQAKGPWGQNPRSARASARFCPGVRLQVPPERETSAEMCLACPELASEACVNH